MVCTAGPLGAPRQKKSQPPIQVAVTLLSPRSQMPITPREGASLPTPLALMGLP
jgi:hypothetical protein